MEVPQCPEKLFLHTARCACSPHGSKSLNYITFTVFKHPATYCTLLQDSYYRIQWQYPQVTWRFYKARENKNPRVQPGPTSRPRLRFLFGYLSVLTPHAIHSSQPGSVESKAEQESPWKAVVPCRYLTGGMLRAEQPRALASKGQDH